MKKTIINLASLLLFLGVCFAVPCFLPSWVTSGFTLLLLWLLVIQAYKDRNDYGKV